MLKGQVLEVDERTGEIRLTRTVSLIPYLKAIKQERQVSGKGFSLSKGLRKIGSIPIDVLIAKGIDIYDDDAIRKFLREHPEYRTSEGAI